MVGAENPSVADTSTYETPKHINEAPKGDPITDGSKDSPDASGQPKPFQDILAYEDKWIGWDGPVWCKRYGRFENKEDAAEDDGFTPSNMAQDPAQNLLQSGLHRCDGRASKVTSNQLSYIPYARDMQRRIEPMVASLVNLERRVAHLVHHGAKSVESKLHEQVKNAGAFVQEKAKLGEELGRKREDHASEFGEAEYVERRGESIYETVARLESQVHSLMLKMEAAA